MKFWNYMVGIVIPELHDEHSCNSGIRWGKIILLALQFFLELHASCSASNVIVPEICFVQIRWQLIPEKRYFRN